MSEFEIKPASRVGIVPLIDAYSESGCGKTMSSLLLARGIVGPTGKLVLIDTESGRGSLYADVIPGGYDVLNLTEPFSPQRYIEALDMAEKAGAKAVIVDSMSHEWDGPGSVQDMADENERKSGKPGLHNWRQPKMEHARLVQRLLRSRVPVICCIRAKHKTRQKRDGGKTVIVKDDFTSPIQSEEFIFEATAHFEVMSDHTIRLTKMSHPLLGKCFPTPEEGPITTEHGRKVAEWCAAGTTPSVQPPTSATAPSSVAGAKELKSQLWKLLVHVRGTEQAWDVAERYLHDEMCLDLELKVKELSADQLTTVIDRATTKLRAQNKLP